MRMDRVLSCALLLLTAGTAHGAVIIGNFGAAPAPPGVVFGIKTTTIYAAAGFTMGVDPYVLDSVSLTLDFTWGPGPGVPQLTLWTGAAAPTTQIGAFVNPPFAGKNDFTFKPSQLIVLQPSTTYWLHMVDISGVGNFGWEGTGQPGTDPSGVATHASFLWNGSPMKSKLRMQVDGTKGLPCSSPYVDYGSGCPGSGAFVPYLSLDNCASAGGMVSMSVSNALGGSTAFLFFGLQQAAVPIGGTGCLLNVAPLFPQIIGIPLGGMGPGAGSVTIAGIIPAGTTGLSFTVQAFVLDPSPPHGYCNSNGVVISIG